MTINPRDYDLEELRKMARERGPGSLPPEREDDTDGAIGGPSVPMNARAGDPAVEAERAEFYREMLPFLEEHVEKPYLHRLPETYTAEFLVFEWLEYLMDRAGYHGAVNALDYYESVEWITGEARSQLSDYLIGVEEREPPIPGELEVEEHMLSLVYVAKLRAMG